jgi:hypothetical protein
VTRAGEVVRTLGGLAALCRMTACWLGFRPPFARHGLGFIHSDDISLARPSQSVPKVGTAFTSVVSPVPVLQWFFPVLALLGPLSQILSHDCLATSQKRHPGR